MDITTLVDLRNKSAGIHLNLKQEVYRAGTEWNLYVTFEVLDTIGKNAIPHTIQIMNNRRPHAIRNQLQMAGLPFVETPLQPAEQSALCRPENLRQAATNRTCSLCEKSNFDDAKGCHNASVFSPCVGDWICNLTVAQ